jgi:hypothetical protein
MKWTEKHIKGLLHQKKIAGYRIPERKKGYSKNGPNVPRRKSKVVEWLDFNLQYWANSHSLTLEKEVVLFDHRRFRWDYVFRSIKVCIEFNGGMFMDKSGHSSVKGLLRDSEKQNLAVANGYRPIVLTSLNYTTVLKTLNEIV